MLGLKLHDAGICPECGFHHTIAADDHSVLAIEEGVCDICKTVDKYARIRRDADVEHEQSLGNKPDPKAPRPSDGRKVTVRLLGDADERRER